jgi:hypothetical protein
VNFGNESFRKGLRQNKRRSRRAAPVFLSLFSGYQAGRGKCDTIRKFIARMN